MQKGKSPRPDAKVAPGRRRMNNVDDRRQQLVEQTVQLYATKGMDAVGYIDIANACGVTRRLVQHYFPTPETLRMSTVKVIRDRFHAFCGAAMSGIPKVRDRLIAYINATCDWVDQNPGEARVWLLYFYYCGMNPAYRAMHTDLLYRANEQLQDMLRLGQGQGEFGEIEDLQTTAKLIQNSIAGIMLMKVTETTSPNEKSIRRHTIELCLNLANAKTPTLN